MAVDEKQLTEDILRLAATDVSRCMQCGRCSANCEAASKMDLLPHRVVWDLNSGYASELLEADAPWQCLSCMACEERCPRGVSPARVMEALRLLQIRQQGKNKLPKAWSIILAICRSSFWLQPLENTINRGKLRAKDWCFCLLVWQQHRRHGRCCPGGRGSAPNSGRCLCHRL